MRFSALYTIPLALLFVGQAAQALTPHGALSKRTFDQCGCLDEDLTFPWTNQNGRRVSMSSGKLNFCFCLKDIDFFVNTNPIAQGCTKYIGKVETTKIIRGIFERCKQKRDCSFPKRGGSRCKPKPSNYCDFECDNGYDIGFGRNGQPEDCVCRFPKTECNGTCGYFRSCPSSAPRIKREQEALAQGCKAGFKPCAIPGRSSLQGKQWECVDVKSDLESCGGCTPDTLLGLPNEVAGTDCTAIPGVSDVSCIEGACAVRKCDYGYQVSLNGESCEKISAV